MELIKFRRMPALKKGTSGTMVDRLLIIELLMKDGCVSFLKFLKKV